MAKLIRDEETGYFTRFNEFAYLNNVHDPALCEGRGCAIHAHPTDHPLKDAPLNWRTDRSILERICEHGIGHPDYDSALYLLNNDQAYENIHGCDGCCQIVVPY